MQMPERLTKKMQYFTLRREHTVPSSVRNMLLLFIIEKLYWENGHQGSSFQANWTRGECSPNSWLKITTMSCLSSSTGNTFLVMKVLNQKRKVAQSFGYLPIFTGKEHTNPKAKNTNSGSVYWKTRMMLTTAPKLLPNYSNACHMGKISKLRDPESRSAHQQTLFLGKFLQLLEIA